MPETANFIKTATGLAVSGNIDFFSVMKLLKISLPIMTETTNWTIDCSGISTVNSAALALFLEWAKKAKQDNKALTFTHLPPQVLSLMEAAGMKAFVT